MSRLLQWLTARRRSAVMLVVAVAAFVLMILLAPAGQERPWLALLLFAGVLGIVRMLSQFEKPV